MNAVAIDFGAGFVATADDIILDLIATGRRATADEVDAIIAHVAQAPFATYLARVPPVVRTAAATAGLRLPKRLPSVEIHLIKRIYKDEQWPAGTKVDRYVTDLHQAVQHPATQVWTYRYYRRPYAGFFGPSHVLNVPKPERFIFVAYSPEFGTIATGYQTGGPHMVFDRRFTNVVRHR